MYLSKSIKIIFICSLLTMFAIIGFFVGAYAIKKSMEIKIGFDIQPQIRCELWLHTDIDGQEDGEDVYNKMFCNVEGREFVASNIELNKSFDTLTLPNSFHGGIGAGFKLKVYNYTNAPVFVSSQGEGVSLHAVVCDGYTNGTPTPQILSVNSVSTTASIVFDTTFYEVSFNNDALVFDNMNTNVAENNGHYYINSSQQLTGQIMTTSGNIVIYSIQIGETTYDYSQIYSWITASNVLTIANNLITGDIVIYGNIGEYTRLSYLQSTGTQYINTGVNDADKLAVSCDFEIVTYVNNNYIFGAQQSSGAMLYNGLYARSSGDSSLEYNWITIDFADSNRIVMSQSISGTTNTIVINGVTYTVSTGTSNGTRMLIFACYRYSGALRNFEGQLKCYYFKMVNDGTLVRDFIPLLRTSDNKPGMYDLVNGVFYTNAGTGEFLYG